jgi:hypothetical protein
MRSSVNVTAVTASGASADSIGKVIATKAKANNKDQIPIFRMSRLSINMINPALVLARIGFAVENVKLIVLKGIGANRLISAQYVREHNLEMFLDAERLPC